MRVAIHQPNFIPWFPFFYKMAMVDRFYLLNEVQFEKNGYQNRFNYKDKWITKPVVSGKEYIWYKNYVGHENDLNGFMPKGSLMEINTRWINLIKDTLNIDTRIHTYERPPSYKEFPVNFVCEPSDKTKRLITIIKRLKGDVYVTNPEAKDKYLDEDMMKAEGIEVEYCKVPKHLQKSTFEVIEEYGIEGTIKQLPKCKALSKS